MRDPDAEAIAYARAHLDLTKDLNAQGYYGPLPNDADPRTNCGVKPDSEADKERYAWMDEWIAANNGVIDNAKMDLAWRAYQGKKYPGKRWNYRI